MISIMGLADGNIWVIGLIIFFARICDVSIGTVRTIITVQGRTVIAFFLAIFEVTIWIAVASTVIVQIRERPVLVVFYALGYATGNVIGILVERKLAFGLLNARVITRQNGAFLADALRQKGQPVTIFHGEGMAGPVMELYIACRRRDLAWILSDIKALDPEAFYVVEQVRDMNKIFRPSAASGSGWSISKRK